MALALFVALRGTTGAVWASLIAVAAPGLGTTWANRRYTFGYHDANERNRHYVSGFAIMVGAVALSSVAVTPVTGSVAQLLALLASWAIATLARFALLRRIFRA